MYKSFALFVVIVLLLCAVIPADAATPPGISCAVQNAQFMSITRYWEGSQLRFVANPATVRDWLLLEGDGLGFHYNPDYYALADGRIAYNDGSQGWPYLIQFYSDKRSSAQALIGFDSDLPDVVFVYVYTNYFYQLQHSTNGQHPVCAFTIDRAVFDQLIGELG